ncbi:MAG: hypothetical protein ACI97B_002252, partial [Verrucomicrobiales bacterium]
SSGRNTSSGNHQEIHSCARACSFPPTGTGFRKASDDSARFLVLFLS